MIKLHFKKIRLIASVYNNREVNKFDRCRSRKHDSFGSPSVMEARCKLI